MASQKEATLLLKIKTMGDEALKSISESFDTLKLAGLAAFGAISFAVYKGIDEFKESEEVTNALTQAMVNNGVYSKALRDDYLNQAKALQGLTAFSDEQVIKAQTAIIQQVGQKKVTEELTKAVLDFATAQKMDSASAAELVGKSIGTATNALGRYGIAVTQGASETQKMTEVVHGLNQKFGGQAEAAVQGLGALKQLTNIGNDLFETFGGKLAPTIIQIVGYFKDLAGNTGMAEGAMDVFIGALKFVVTQSIQAFGELQLLGLYIGGGLATSIEAVSQALSGNFAQALETITTGYTNIQEEALKIETQTMNRIQAINEAETNGKAAELAKDEENLRKSLENKAALRLQKSEEQKALEIQQFEEKIKQQDIDDNLMKSSYENHNLEKINADIAKQKIIYENAKTHTAKMKALQEEFRLGEMRKEAIKDQLEIQRRKEIFSQIASLSSSNNSTLASIGKAAGITQIAIDTPVAISKALAAFPPPFNFAAAGIVGIAMAQQAAQIAGIPLAEGGIVKARPGGIQATIGEGGRDEAVIPLENGQIPGSGGNTFILQGPIFLGDERSASQFIEQVDQGLLKLRQNGGSVSFGRV